MSTTTFYASTDHLEAFLAQHARPGAREERVIPAASNEESPPTPGPGSLTGYQPSLAPKRSLVPLKPKGFRPTRRGVALAVAAVLLVGDALWWWFHHRS